MFCNRRVICLVLSMGIWASCHGQKESYDDTTSETETGTETGEEDSDTGSSAPWKESSTRLIVWGGSFWDGSFGFEQVAEDLTEEQHERLQALTVKPGQDSCAYDISEFSVTIEDRDGTSAVYYTDEFENTCGSKTKKILDFKKFSSLAATFSCHYAQQGEGLFEAPLEAKLGDGCHHGRFVPHGQDREEWFLVSIEDQDVRARFFIHGLNRLGGAVTVYDASGNNVLGTDRIETAGDKDEPRASVDLDLHSVSQVLVKVECFNIGLQQAGDYYFRAERRRKGSIQPN